MSQEPLEATIKEEVVENDVKPDIKDVKVEIADDASASDFPAFTPMVIRGQLDPNASRKLVKMSDLCSKKMPTRKEPPGPSILTPRQQRNEKRKKRKSNAQKKLVVAALEAAKTDDEKRDDAGNVICTLHPSNMHEKGKRQSMWCPLETELFYKVLAFTGTDFSMMQEYISFRTREECKKKYCREERLNRAKVNEILANPSEFDPDVIEAEIVELKARALVQRMAKNPERATPGILKPVKKEG
uniref:Myb_DNA-bind_7 domain-containing protein n=1 Tax=Panagrellus redivivus TaxID=6233 RepID=A0A7E4V7Z2_PANRE